MAKDSYDSGDAKPESDESDDASNAEMPEENDDADDSGDEKLLTEAKARFERAKEAETENRRLAHEDLKFFAGEQWPPEIKRERDADGRPCLTINRMPQFVRQVTNDQRQNRPSIKVHPVDDGADVNTAKVYQGLIRHIEYNSNADAAYDTGFESAAKIGFGFFRFVTEYVSPLSFEQEILFKRVPDPFKVLLDPHSQEPDGEDADYGFVFEQVSKKEYKRRYPDSDLAKGQEWELTGTSWPEWVSEDSAIVAEYFYKEFEEKDLVLLSNGMVRLAEDLKNMPAGVEEVDRRKTQVPVIRWCKFNACEILDKTDWPGSYIPIVPIYGSEQFIDGKRVLEGIVRPAKDPARMYNFWKSAETEAIALAPRAPFIVADGQLEDYEGEWKTANRRNHPYLTYKPTNNAGQPVPPPARQPVEPAVQAITQAAMLAADDIKATTGIYDAALGARSNETSGIAIQRRNQQAQTSTFHYVDNLTRSIKHAGRILLDLIPRVYDTARTARIVGEDGNVEVIRLNDPNFKDPKTGEPRFYDLSVGKYDVTVDVGPSFATKRQEAAASMLEVAKTNPQIMGVAADLMVKNMDWPGAQEIAERLKKMLPPQLQDQQQGQIPPEAQAQIQQAQQMIAKLTEELNKAKDPLESKRMELESRERIEMAKLQVDIEITLAKLGSNEAIKLLGHELAQLEQRLDLLQQNQPITYQDPHDMPPMPPQGAGPMNPMNPPMEMPPEQMGAPGEQVPQGNPTGGMSPGTPMEPEGPMS